MTGASGRTQQGVALRTAAGSAAAEEGESLWHVLCDQFSDTGYKFIGDFDKGLCSILKRSFVFGYSFVVSLSLIVGQNSIHSLGVPAGGIFVRIICHVCAFFVSAALAHVTVIKMREA